MTTGAVFGNIVAFTAYNIIKKRHEAGLPYFEAG
jgi:hypothetical protein